MRLLVNLVGFVAAAGMALALAVYLYDVAQHERARAGAAAIRDAGPFADPEPALRSAEPASASDPLAGYAGGYEEFVDEQRALDRLGVGDALARNYPAEHANLMRALYAAAREGEPQRELERRRSQFVGELLSAKITYTPFAGSEALRSYIAYNLQLADLAQRKFGAQVCAQAATRGGAAFTERLRSAEPDVVEAVIATLANQTGAILDAAREGETAGARELEAPTPSEWRALHREMEKLGATRSQIGMFMAGADGDPEDVCAVTQAFYAALLSLDSAASERLLPFVARRMTGSANG